MENIESINNVHYELYCRPLGNRTVQEPDGWADDVRSMERQKDSKAIISKTEINLEFFGDGADFIRDVFTNFGVAERVLLTKREKNLYSKSENWMLRYVQELDLKTYKEDARTGKITVKATEGGLYDDIDNRISDKYNLINMESADGINIGPIESHTFIAKPRGILLDSKLQASGVTNYRVNSDGAISEGVTKTCRSIPMEVLYKSEDSVSQPASAVEAYNDLKPHPDATEQIGAHQEGTLLFYERAPIAKTVDLSLELDFYIEKTEGRFHTNEQGRVELRIMKRNVNSEVLKEIIVLKDFTPTPGNSHSVSYSNSIELDKDDSMAIVFVNQASIYNTDPLRAGWFHVFFNVSKSVVTLSDSEQHAPTATKCVKPLHFFDRIVAKITGKKGLVRSTLFEEGGEMENFVVDFGLWARGFPDMLPNEDGEEEEEIQFSTSFKDAIQAFGYWTPLCWYIDIEHNQQVVRIEKAIYTMQNFVGITLGEVNDVKYESSEPDWFGSIELGHDREMDYEEINGLDEPNGLSEFGTHITRSKNRYSHVSKYRYDSVGYELIRRLNYKEYPKRDTPRDKDIWIHDAKYLDTVIGGIYTHNTWEDHFDEAPTGIFSPDTAWNLRFSPMNRLFYGHGYSVKRCLYHAPDKKIRFGSSNANMRLKTVMNGIELEENGEIRIGDIETARVEAAMTEVTFRMNQIIENMFSGFTKVDGRLVPNYFGLIEYKVNGQKRYGRLVKLQTRDESKLMMINAKM